MALAAAIFGKGTRYRRKFNLNKLDKWLSYTVGWAEVDSLCQSNFDAKEVIQNWPSWQAFLIKLSTDKNIHKRRASMVLLCKPLRQSDDTKLPDLALKLVNDLKHEKEILITKAVSWILRSMVKHHPKELAIYLEENKDSLPSIAYRESTRKLRTGKKN